jgi:antitoxin (DNA-binding transcriptional repressor) of toxin-antitoxin stability system
MSDERIGTVMSTIGIKELRGDIDSVLERVTNEGETIEIVKDGLVVAQLAPVAPTVSAAEPGSEDERMAQHAAVWAELDRIGQRLSESWPPGLTAVDAIREERRG